MCEDGVRLGDDIIKSLVGGGKVFFYFNVLYSMEQSPS